MPKAAGDSTRVAILTALITAGATVLTAFIGVLPQMRQTDRAKIDDLTKQIETMKSPGGLYKITGQVKAKSTNTAFKDAVVFAAPAQDSASLDDNGAFLLQNMPRMPYVVVVASQTGTHRLLINPDDPSTDSDDLTISYAFSPE